MEAIRRIPSLSLTNSCPGCVSFSSHKKIAATPEKKTFLCVSKRLGGKLPLKHFDQFVKKQEMNHGRDTLANLLRASMYVILIWDQHASMK